MSEHEVTHDEIDAIVERSRNGVLTVQEDDILAKYAAEQREKDEQRTVAAKTLGEFRARVAEEVDRMLGSLSGHDEDLFSMADFAIDNIPREEPEPSDLDRLVAALMERRHATKQRRWIAVSSLGTFQLLSTNNSGAYCKEGGWHQLDEMIAQLETSTPVTFQRAAELNDGMVSCCRHGPHAAEVTRFFKQGGVKG